jgi:hypothetical protein
MYKVAALYIDPRGPYPGLLGPEMCWDEKRDARTYEGPWPVVAHPPCGPWTRNAFASQQDPNLGRIAFDQVRRFGGVLEQPAHSRLFAECKAPKPEESDDVGTTIEVCQVDWGHVARKRTWLYIVTGKFERFDSMPPKRKPTHWCRKQCGQIVPHGIKMCSREQRRRTPPAFALWLVQIAAQAAHR